MMPPGGVRRIDRKLIYSSAWKNNSPKLGEPRAGCINAGLQHSLAAKMKVKVLREAEE
jgi:hypothetical protein